MAEHSCETVDVHEWAKDFHDAPRWKAVRLAIETNHTLDATKVLEF